MLQNSTSSAIAYTTTGPNDWIANGSNLRRNNGGSLDSMGSSNSALSTGGTNFGWFELTKGRLMSALGTTNTVVAEDRFEELVQSWGKANFPSFSVPSVPIDAYNTRPDGTSIGQTIIMPSGKIVPNTILWEAKAKSVSNMRNKKQQQRTIDYLSQLNAGETRNAYNVVTTADVVSINNIRDYGVGGNVAVHHLVPYYRRNFNGSYSFKLMERNQGLIWGYNDREPTIISTIFGQRTIKF